MRIQESMIEFSPFSIKGKKSLNKLIESMRKKHIPEEDIKNIGDSDSFLSNYYIEPFTRGNDGNWINDNVSEEDKDVYDVDVLQAYKDKFEQELSERVAKLLWISGNAGCGKSTYVHKLGQIKQDELEMIFSDFEATKKKVSYQHPWRQKIYDRSRCFVEQLDVV